MKNLNMCSFGSGYKTLFRETELLGPCPEGFEKVSIGNRLKIEVYRSLGPITQEQISDIDIAPVGDFCPITQIQPDGHCIISWMEV